MCWEQVGLFVWWHDHPSLEVAHCQTVQSQEERWMKTLCTLMREGREMDWWEKKIADCIKGESKKKKRRTEKEAFGFDQLATRRGGIRGQITVSTVSQLDLSDNQSPPGKLCNPGHERVGQGQGLWVIGLTDKRDWCPLTKLEPHLVTAAALPSPQGPWGGLKRYRYNPPSSLHSQRYNLTALKLHTLKCYPTVLPCLVLSCPKL